MTALAWMDRIIGKMVAYGSQGLLLCFMLANNVVVL
jgi:hypothetical protein